MLDYAANVVAHWPPATLRDLYEARVRSEGGDPEAALHAFLSADPPASGDDDALAGEFWGRAADNLRLHHMRLVFVADVIPRELQRIVEFLNESMPRTDVLAIEVRQYLGADHRVLVPRVIGNTTLAEETKQSVPGVRSGRKTWTLEEFRAAVDQAGDTDVVALLSDALDWSGRHGGSPVLGHGKYGPIYPTVPDRNGALVKSFALDTNGLVNLNYNELKPIPPYDDEAARLELNRLINTIEGMSISDDMARRASWPMIRLDVLREPERRRLFFEVLDEVARQVREPYVPSGSAAIAARERA